MTKLVPSREGPVSAVGVSYNLHITLRPIKHLRLSLLRQEEWICTLVRRIFRRNGVGAVNGGAHRQDVGSHAPGAPFQIHDPFAPPRPTPIPTPHALTLSRELNDPVKAECFAQCWHSSNSHLGVWYHLRGGGGRTEGRTRSPEE